MQIVTYNIHGWRMVDGKPNLDAVTDVLRSIDADIIGLNEVFYPRTVPGDRRPALEVLAARLKMHFIFGPCLRWPAEKNMPADAYGNALLSRWPIIAGSAHHLTPKEEDKSGVLQDKEQRGLLEARILTPGGGTFTVYVTHLDHTDENARMVQLRVARTWLVRDRNRPHVVMGDFNAIIDFPPAPKLGIDMRLKPELCTESELRGEQLFWGKAKCSICHGGPAFGDDYMHNLQVERFYTGRPEGPIKTFPLRNIKDSPPYLHDGRCPTLHDVVEFFNLILEL
ncbi:MAG: endonuclease/exonuclease/phosphatase family protein, partial [Caldilinea sp.]|nr:endonuclease/exonuclease/phosphatase family protein [Caldilinea sp.]MDW8439480.1 endonuclease/exonuclease/phosphatase family protein [Caldilineaceae bacterium]